MCVVALTFLLAQAPTLAERTPAPVIAAERMWAGPDVLLPLARSSDHATAVTAIRALGRLQDRTVVPALLQFLDSSISGIRDAAAAALAQTLATADLKTDADVIASVADRLLAGQYWRALSHISLPDAAHAAAVEKLLDDVLGRTVEAALAFESLVRRNGRLPGFSLRPESVQLLRSTVLGRHPNGADGAARRYALWTLIQARATTAEVLRAALDDRDAQTRRLTVQALAASAAPVDDVERSRALERALKDPSVIVRVEAVRSYAKHAASAGACRPLLDALDDPAAHVVNVALDALGAACPQDMNVTNRLAREAVAPPTPGPWQRQAHAFVSLASRDRARAESAMPAFAGHPVWEVRMYAARAAAALDDEPALSRLAMDDSVNVRSAALPALHALSAEHARPALLAALERRDYQLVRTAAMLLKKDPPSRSVYVALIAALQRITKEHAETSRDARLPILDAIAVHGSADDASDLVPLLTDLDPQVSARASAILHDWGRTVTGGPAGVSRDEAVGAARTPTCVAVEMASGRRMRLQPDAAAPVTSERFLSLALDRHFYDGLTFHRVEPNFVIQGGSPGANEYSSGLDRFMRDEIGLSNVRGAVGLSTRGLNTADGQIYILLVDEPRLDGRYTIFAHVFDTPEDMRTLDGIQEGDTIAQIKPVSCAR